MYGLPSDMLSACFQFLLTENTRLDLEVKDILNDLNHQQDENELMCNKIEQLELSLNHSKVLPFSLVLIVVFLLPDDCYSSYLSFYQLLYAVIRYIW